MALSEKDRNLIAKKIARSMEFSGFELDGERIKRFNQYEGMSRTEKANRLNSEMGQLWRSGYSRALKELRAKGVIGNKPGMKEAARLTSPVISRHLKEHMPTYMARVGITSADVNSQEFKDEWELIVDTDWSERGFESMVTGDLLKHFASAPKPLEVSLESMSTEELLNSGYVRIPGFTRKDGTKVKSHIRKLK